MSAATHPIIDMKPSRVFFHLAQKCQKDRAKKSSLYVYTTISMVLPLAFSFRISKSSAFGKSRLRNLSLLPTPDASKEMF